MTLMEKARADAREREKERKAKERRDRKVASDLLKAETQEAAEFATEKLGVSVAAEQLKAHPEPVVGDSSRHTWEFEVEGLTLCVAAGRGTRKTLYRLRHNADDHEWRIVRRLADLAGA